MSKAMAGLLTRRPVSNAFPKHSVAYCSTLSKGAAHSSGTVQDSHLIPF